MGKRETGGKGRNARGKGEALKNNKDCKLYILKLKIIRVEIFGPDDAKNSKGNCVQAGREVRRREDEIPRHALREGGLILLPGSGNGGKGLGMSRIDRREAFWTLNGKTSI